MPVKLLEVFKMPFSADWISAAEAINLLSHRFHGRSRAKEAVALALRESLLEARASTHSVATSGGKGSVDESSDDDGLSIPSDIWSRSLHWDDDRDDWEWAIGEFSVDVEPWPGDLHVFRDVHFSRKEIQTMDPDNPVFAVLAAPKPQRKEGRGSAARYWDWDPAFAALVTLAEYDGLDGAEFGDLTVLGNQTKLEKWFADWFTENHLPVDGRASPSENELRKRAKLVVASLRRRKEGLN